MKWMIPVLVVVALLVALLVFSQQTSGPLVVSGFVEADEIRVGSRIGGRVARVHVEEGQVVSAGEVLIELDPFDLQERLAQAEQTLAQAAAAHDMVTAGYRVEEIARAEARRDQMAAELDKLQSGPRPQEIAAARSQLQLAQAELDLASTVYERAQTLFAKKAGDRNQLDAAATQLKVAREVVNARQAALDLLNEGTRREDVDRAAAQLREYEQELKLTQTGYRDEEIREAQAKREGAAAAVAAIKRQLDELKVVAPIRSVVEAIELRGGDLVAPNAPVISLADDSRMWVRAYVPEDHLDVRTGQSVTVRIDSFPDREFPGEIVFVARQAEFTPGNVQTPEQRSRQVFRIKVRLLDGLDVLRPGMAADVVLPLGSD